jgi:Putative prokaryotic signal transducing protein
VPNSRPIGRTLPEELTVNAARRTWDDAAMSELVQIYATGDQMIAELTRARLENEGLDVLVKNSMGGSSAYPVGPSYLFVPAEQADAARQVIAAIESGAYALDEDEPVD